MGLSVSTGISSGINTDEVIQQLMALESRPLAVIQGKQAAFEAKISAYGSIKSALSTLKTNLASLKNDTIFAMSAGSSDTSILTASAESTAAVGSYSIKVNNLATSQSLYSGIFSSASSAVADLTTVASQKLKVKVGNGTASTITIDSTNNTLSGIKDAINNAGVGVTAAIVNVGFVVDSTNNAVVFNDGADRTATLTAGTYTGAEMAVEIKTALEAANAGSDTYTVAYDVTTKKFTITNDSGNANAVDFLSENSGTTAEEILGFNRTGHSPIAVGSLITSDNAVDGARLTFTPSGPGELNRIIVTVDEDNNGTHEEATAETDLEGLSRLAFNATYDSAGATTGGTRSLTQSQAAVDASLDINGLTVTRSSNTISDIITGVTLDLLSAPTAKPTVTLTLSKDLTSITEHINSFAGSYNKVVSLSKTVSSGGGNLLNGDSTTRGLINSLRSAITTKFAGNTVASFGLSHSKEGVLSLDESILGNAVDNDVTGLLASVDAMAESLEDTVDNYVNSLIPFRVDGLNTSVKNAKDRIESYGRRLTIKEASLISQFSAMEETLARLQAGGDFLSQQLASITSIANNIVGGS